MSKEAADKRFLKEWEEQRKGSPVGFFVLYTVIWTFILYVMVLFYHLAMRTIDIGFMPPVIRVLKYVLMALLITVAFYYRGQYRYYRTRFEQGEKRS
jgi:hypothetical protein